MHSLYNVDILAASLCSIERGEMMILYVRLEMIWEEVIAAHTLSTWLCTDSLLDLPDFVDEIWYQVFSHGKEITMCKKQVELNFVEWWVNNDICP
jgi:hypothetical protein